MLEAVAGLLLENGRFPPGVQKASRRGVPQHQHLPTEIVLLVMLGTILLVVLILLLLGAVPAWPYSRGWGYGPSGILGVLLVVLIVLLLVGVF